MHLRLRTLVSDVCAGCDLFKAAVEVVGKSHFLMSVRLCTGVNVSSPETYLDFRGYPDGLALLVDGLPGRYWSLYEPARQVWDVELPEKEVKHSIEWGKKHEVWWV